MNRREITTLNINSIVYPFRRADQAFRVLGGANPPYDFGTFSKKPEWN